MTQRAHQHTLSHFEKPLTTMTTTTPVMMKTPPMPSQTPSDSPRNTRPNSDDVSGCTVMNTLTTLGSVYLAVQLIIRNDSDYANVAANRMAMKTMAGHSLTGRGFCSGAAAMARPKQPATKPHVVTSSDGYLCCVHSQHRYCYMRTARIAPAQSAAA